MYQLISRDQITSSKKIIGTEIIKFQKSFYDVEVLQLYQEENKESEYWEIFDCVKKDPIVYKSFDSIININHTNIETFSQKLTEKLILIFDAINAHEFIVISHLKLDFFGNRKNEFQPLKNVYTKLETIVGDKSYKEAFILNRDSLANFVEILFWLVRYDPNIPEYIFFFDADEQVEFFICKYGNMHFRALQKEQITAEQWKNWGCTIIDVEHDNFTEDGNITEREILM